MIRSLLLVCLVVVILGAADAAEVKRKHRPMGVFDMLRLSPAQLQAARKQYKGPVESNPPVPNPASDFTLTMLTWTNTSFNKEEYQMTEYCGLSLNSQTLISVTVSGQAQGENDTTVSLYSSSGGQGVQYMGAEYQGQTHCQVKPLKGYIQGWNLATATYKGQMTMGGVTANAWETYGNIYVGVALNNANNPLWLYTVQTGALGFKSLSMIQSFRPGTPSSDKFDKPPAC